MQSLVHQTDEITPVVEYIQNLFTERKEELGLADVFYGDQQKIPRTPTLCVEPGTFSSEVSGIGGKGRTDNLIRVYLLLYHSNLNSVQSARNETDKFAEKIKLVLHEDITMGGLVIHGYVREIEPGYSVRNNTLLRSSRLSWAGATKTLIR